MIELNAQIGLPQAADSGGYASADDLMLVSDLDEQDLSVRRWHRNGTRLRIRVRALDFDQQEKIERGALIKLDDGTVARSEARFAALTLFYGVLVPKLTLEQAHAMRKHNPAIITEIVKFIWYNLSVWDQELVDGVINESIPGATEPPSNAGSDDTGDTLTPVASADRLLEWEPTPV